jgi:signal peptidase II
VASPDGDVPTELEAPPAPRKGFLATYGLIAIIVVVVLLADQLTKSWAVSRLSNDLDGIHVVGSLHLRLAFNSGMAFSKGEGKGPIIGAIALAIVGAMVWFARSVTDTLSRVAIGLVIGGALGNLCDRLFRAGLPRSGLLGGRVIDFVYLGWWPTFNIADSCVVVGGILLAIATLRLPTSSDPTSA